MSNNYYDNLFMPEDEIDRLSSSLMRVGCNLGRLSQCKDKKEARVVHKEVKKEMKDFITNGHSFIHYCNCCYKCRETTIIEKIKDIFPYINYALKFNLEKYENELKCCKTMVDDMKSFNEEFKKLSSCYGRFFTGGLDSKNYTPLIGITIY